jgi:hypothetical protein
MNNHYYYAPFPAIRCMAHTLCAGLQVARGLLPPAPARRQSCCAKVATHAAAIGGVWSGKACVY